MEEHYIDMCNSKGLILINAFSDAQIPTATRFQEEFCKLGVNVELKRNSDFLSWIRHDKIISHFGYKFCIYFDQDFYIGRLFEKLNLKLYNNIVSVETCADKMLTYIALANSGIRMPNTISGFRCYTKGKNYLDSQLDYVIQNLKLPLVAKLCYGSSGDSVFLIKDKSALKEFCLKYRYQPHLFQEYIQSSFGKDIRVMVIGHKAIGAMLRTNDTDFRSNLACSGKGEFYQLDGKLKLLAERVSQILNLDYCGIDFLLGQKGEHILCEVNSNAFIIGFEKATGINVAKVYVEYILNHDQLQ